MAYSEKLAERVRRALSGKGEFSEKKMFGGLCFLLSGKMCCGVLKDKLVARVDPKDSEVLINKPFVRPMDFTGRPMKGFLYIEPEELKSVAELNQWLKRCVAFASSLSSQKKVI